jgi:hypothetical protein
MDRFLVPLFLALLHLTPFSTLEARDQNQGTADRSLAVIRGRVVCLDPRDRGEAIGCTGSTNNFGLISASGKRYTFLSSDTSTAMFADSRVRQRELQITGKLLPDDKLEIVTVQSIRDGKLYDIYYFCELCNITAYAPGPCVCCRQELEFRETPT